MNKIELSSNDRVRLRERGSVALSGLFLAGAVMLAPLAGNESADSHDSSPGQGGVRPSTKCTGIGLEKTDGINKLTPRTSHPDDVSLDQVDWTLTRSKDGKNNIVVDRGTIAGGVALEFSDAYLKEIKEGGRLAVAMEANFSNGVEDGCGSKRVG